MPLFGEEERHLVDRAHVLSGDDGLLVDVAEQSDLRFEVPRQRPVGAAEENVGLDTDGPELAHAVLSRLGLLLSRGGDEGYEGEVNEDRPGTSDVHAELAHRLEERKALDVSHRTADLDDDDVGSLGDRLES